MKGKTKNQQNKRYNKKFDSNSVKFNCFGCGKQGHMKANCPNLANKEKATEREERHILHGKTMHPHPAVHHRKNLKQICVSWLGKTHK